MKSKGSGRRGRLLVAVAVSFAISAIVTTLVGATISGTANTFTGDAGPNEFEGGDGPDTMNGGGGDDILRGRFHADILFGDEGNDTLIGDEVGDSPSSDSVNGGDGNDDVTGGGGSDIVNGDGGDDLVGSLDLSEVGGTAISESGDDSLTGGFGNDVVLAGPGADSAAGGDGADSLYGEGGDDLITPGPGPDAANGGDGVDRLIYGPAVGTAVIVDMTAGTASGGAGDDTFENFENVDGGLGEDSIDGDDGPNRIDGQAGGDTIDGGPAADTVFGGPGDDTLRSAETSGSGDSLSAGEGSDRIEARNGIVDAIDCGEGGSDADFAVADASDEVAANCETVLFRDPVPRTLTVAVNGAGNGRVTGPGISCPGDCTQVFDEGTVVALTSRPAAGSRLTGWGGACTGAGPCAVTMSVNRNVTATFAPSTPPDTTAPETSIDSGPDGKVKAKKRKATVRFGFSSSEAGSTFECSLDGESLGVCESPLKLKVKRGKHRFDVAATDKAGNEDATPAKRKFKVVRKRG